LEFDQLGAEFVKLVTRLVQLALYSHGIAKGGILLVDAFHLHQGVSRSRLLLNFRLYVVELLLQSFFTLIRWQIAEVLLCAITISRNIILE
jgi:hypothetical protein